MTGDWITVHRKLLTNPVMQHDGLFRLWMYCLMKAAWKDGKWLMPGTTTVMNVKRGQFITGRESLHGALYGSEYSGEHKPSSRTVWRWLESLAEMDCVTLDTVSNRCTIVTVVKYNTYQKDKQTDVQPMSVSCPTEKRNLGNSTQNVSNLAQQLSDGINGSCDDVNAIDVQHMSSTCPADVPHMSTVEERNKSIREQVNTHAADAAKSDNGSGTALGYPQAFEDFWLAYPKRDGRRRGKDAAFGLWKRMQPTAKAELQVAVANYAKSRDAQKGFAKDPERFLKKNFWRDFLNPVGSGTLFDPSESPDTTGDPTYGRMSY